jgi:hypothetical protein
MSHVTKLSAEEVSDDQVGEVALDDQRPAADRCAAFESGFVCRIRNTPVRSELLIETGGIGIQCRRRACRVTSIRVVNRFGSDESFAAQYRIGE